MGKILQARFINPFLYRPNVACLLYKKEPDEKSQRQIKILLVEREDDPGHWQLPQGGLDGETPRVAGRRELREETGAIDIEEKAVFKNVYRYKFGSGTNDSGLSYPENWDVQEAENKSKHQIEEQGIKTENLPQSACAYKYDYQGQKQSLFVAEFHGEDSDLKVNFWDHRAWKWVDAERLAEEVHPVRRAAAKIFLEKFKTIEELKI
jgi:putative (di)nucleoside polyphosphate hydrolase